jgi:hypothetical protein
VIKLMTDYWNTLETAVAAEEPCGVGGLKTVAEVPKRLADAPDADDLPPIAYMTRRVAEAPRNCPRRKNTPGLQVRADPPLR